MRSMLALSKVPEAKSPPPHLRQSLEFRRLLDGVQGQHGSLRLCPVARVRLAVLRSLRREKWGMRAAPRKFYHLQLKRSAGGRHNGLHCERLRLTRSSYLNLDFILFKQKQGRSFVKSSLLCQTSILSIRNGRCASLRDAEYIGCDYLEYIGALAAEKEDLGVGGAGSRNVC